MRRNPSSGEQPEPLKIVFVGLIFSHEVDLSLYLWPGSGRIVVIWAVAYTSRTAVLSVLIMFGCEVIVIQASHPHRLGLHSGDSTGPSESQTPWSSFQWS